MINDPTGLPFLQKKGIENQSTENQYLTRYWLAENQYLANTWPDIGFRFPAVKMVHRLGRSSYTKPERTPAQVGNKRRRTGSAFALPNPSSSVCYDMDAREIIHS
jgi:hypothetical protein